MCKDDESRADEAKKSRKENIRIKLLRLEHERIHEEEDYHKNQEPDENKVKVIGSNGV